jgi:hypothetical protein
MDKTRFDMEQEIMDCWHITEDLNILAENVLEKDADKDTIANVLLGLQTLYQMKFERLFDTFEGLVHTGKFRSDFNTEWPFPGQKVEKTEIPPIIRANYDEYS